MICAKQKLKGGKQQFPLKDFGATKYQIIIFKSSNNYYFYVAEESNEREQRVRAARSNHYKTRVDCLLSSLRSF